MTFKKYCLLCIYKYHIVYLLCWLHHYFTYADHYLMICFEYLDFNFVLMVETNKLVIVGSGSEDICDYLIPAFVKYDRVVRRCYSFCRHAIVR